MTRIEQLERQVEVLREALADYAAEYSYSMAGDALAAAARIAAEPVEATDAEVVASLVERGHGGIGLDVPDGTLEWFDNLSEAAAWLRAQKEAGNG